MEATPDQRKTFAAALDERITTALLPEVAEHLGVGVEGVRMWMRGRREPPRSTVFEIEAFLREKPGTLSRLLGYLPPSARAVTTVEDAINADPRLTPTKRGYLLTLYRDMTGD